MSRDLEQRVIALEEFVNGLREAHERSPGATVDHIAAIIRDGLSLPMAAERDGRQSLQDKIAQHLRDFPVEPPSPLGAALAVRYGLSREVK